MVVLNAASKKEEGMKNEGNFPKVVETNYKASPQQLFESTKNSAKNAIQIARANSSGAFPMPPEGEVGFFTKTLAKLSRPVNIE